MPRLGVNVDHVATLRQARQGAIPSPVWAAVIAEQAGCEGVVCHLREDRRHIQEKDLWDLKEVLQTPLNLEMAVFPSIVRIACRLKPHQATLVPEKRIELTTEGGLDLAKNEKVLGPAVHQLQKAGVRVSLFIDPDRKQIERASRLGVPMVELHTGGYAEARTKSEKKARLSRLEEAAYFAQSKKLVVAAGHGLDYENVKPVAKIPPVVELNIGFSIVARALAVGFHEAVREMKELMGGATA